MAEPEHVVREKLARVFARQDFYEACSRRDAGAVVRICNANGITQGQLAALTGLAQSTLSNYARGKNSAQWASTFKTLADGLGMPPPLRQALLSGDASGDGSSPAVSAVAGLPADTYDLQLLAEVVGRNGTNVKRRDMLALAAQLGATATLAQSGVWERLAHALTNPSAMDETTIRDMEARSAGFHRLEEIVSAPVLLKGLTVHLNEVSTLLNGSSGDPDDDLRRRLIVVAGESSVLAGWAASDTGDSAAARSFYDTAITAAKQASDPAIAACALAYRSYIPSTKGSNGRARVLLSEALQNISGTESPATMAWIAARHAEESAQLGDKPQALASWERAEEAFSISDPDEDRVWTRFLDRNRFDSYRIATYSRIGRLDEAQEVAASVLTRLTQPDRKKAVIIFEDIAAAHLARGSVNEASRVARRGLAILRETGFVMWLPKFATLAQGLNRWQRQPQVRAYLEDFAMTKRQFATSAH
jgi:transcriptional regulator with XRE-family HTH domain/tetratricopeptide (TPR) repeat protein